MAGCVLVCVCGGGGAVLLLGFIQKIEPLSYPVEQLLWRQDLPIFV